MEKVGYVEYKNIDPTYASFKTARHYDNIECANIPLAKNTLVITTDSIDICVGT